MCTINKSAHTKKSGNLFNDPSMCIYIYIYIYIYIEDGLGMIQFETTIGQTI